MSAFRGLALQQQSLGFPAGVPRAVGGTFNKRVAATGVSAVEGSVFLFLCLTDLSGVIHCG